MLKLSKLLQIVLLLMFFLPFFPKGCEYPSKEEIEAKRIADSIRVLDSIKFIDSLKLINPLINTDSAYKAWMDNGFNNDSIKHDSIITKSTQEINDSIIDTSSNDSEESTDFLSMELSKKNKILKFLLRPNDNYTGIAYVIDSFIWIINYAGITIAFILWIIGLVLKYKRKSIYNVLNIFGLISFYFTENIFIFIDIKLWGYWVTFAFGSIMIILDLYILIKNKIIDAKKQ